MASKFLGIDLGTDSIKIFKSNEGIVLKQKNMIAVDKRKRVYTYGDKAYDMFEKAPEYIELYNPIKHGVIADFSYMQTLIKKFIGDIKGHSINSTGIFVAVPSDITDVERRAFFDLMEEAKIKPKNVYIVNKPIADAVGSGLDVNNAQGIMMVNIGADTTEISILSLGGIVLSKLVKIGGNTLDESICQYIKKNYNLVIGVKSANQLKQELASATVPKKSLKNILGRDIVTGLPKEVEIDSMIIYDAIKEYLYSITDEMKIILERTPPELSADIISSGLYVSGGCANIKNLDVLFADETELKINIVDDAIDSVVNGLGRIIENPELHALGSTMKDPTYS